jgi:GNAT superfamily N-acetyltransferase
VLFEDALPSALDGRGAPFRRLGDEERAGAFAQHEPVGEYGLVLEGEVVASGGFATDYNPPYADLYMEVAPAHRRCGHGAYLVQELKRACRESGHVPAARCHEANVASRRTLERAGMLPCARIVRGIL